MLADTVPDHLATSLCGLTLLQCQLTSVRGPLTSFQCKLTSLRGRVTSFRCQETLFRGKLTSSRGQSAAVRGHLTSFQCQETSFQCRPTFCPCRLTAIGCAVESIPRRLAMKRCQLTLLRGNLPRAAAGRHPFIAGRRRGRRAGFAWRAADWRWGQPAGVKGRLVRRACPLPRAVRLGRRPAAG